MRKNVNNQTMDEELKIFLGIEPKVEEQKPDPAPADTPAQEHEDAQAGTDENMNEQTGEAVQENAEEHPQVVHRISGKQRRASLEEYKAMFLPVPTIGNRKPVSLFGSRRMSVSGLVENIVRHHLSTYGEDIEAWRKL